jgi:hemoglobin
VTTLFEAIGGMPTFVALVDRFYDQVEGDAALRALYPDDLTASRSALALFLAQYFGGPTTYSDEKGHPRLRMRHAHLEIGTTERDGWYAAMAAAVRGFGFAPDVESAMLEYFDRSATWMINT